MREVTVTVPAGETVTAPVIPDQYIAPFQISYSKTGSGTVQVSFTDPFPVVNQNFTTATFTWLTASTVAPNGSTSIGQPVRAIRLSGAAAGDTLTVIQAGAK
jgi:hypothetical protein